MKKEILLISDTEHSALSISARCRSKLINAEVLYGDNFHSVNQLFDTIIEKNPLILFFVWRQSLLDLLNSITQEQRALLKQRRTLAVLIPDHLGLDNPKSTQEFELLNYGDSYYVTSKILYEAYNSIPSIQKPFGILHDLPDVDLIRKTRNEIVQVDSNQVIWVGNSEWGSKQGYTDHKGYRSVIKPLGIILKNHKDCFKLKIVDSARKNVPNEEVLRQIHESSFLLLTSKSEGTGLPLLESLGLGITPLSTRVGIAPELLATHPELIQTLTPDGIHEFLHNGNLGITFSRSEAIELFEEFIETISQEALQLGSVSPKGVGDWNRKGFLARKYIRLLFVYRFLKFKASQKRA
jgi:hypothetical protein